MEKISVFDIFKIGVGPSSSHTMGPWRAANKFINQVDFNDLERVQIDLFGSLSKTGKGHGTDIAIVLGLLKYDPKTVDTSRINEIVSIVKASKTLRIESEVVSFDFDEDIIFHSERLPFHPNGMTIRAIYPTKTVEETYYSIGGGFITQEGDDLLPQVEGELPYTINTETDLLKHIDNTGLSIPEIILANELYWNDRQGISNKIEEIWDTMLECVYRGCHRAGYLPGGLNVKRRAEGLNRSLLQGVEYKNTNEWIEAIRSADHSFTNVTKWVSCFALAVNEENAGFGRVVTAPTNGAAGVIPAVMMYMICFTEAKRKTDIENFMLVAGEIGSLFKKGSTISAAMGGCQAEIGVSSAMAAAGLTQCLGGSAKQALQAAEIAMEHHLGLTCDPINGLVQVPCIERNTMGAMKAITACQMALASNPEEAKVSLDQVIKTMKETAMDMSEKYKETSEGGLAVNISVIVPEC